MPEREFKSFSIGDRQEPASDIHWIQESFPTFAEFAAESYNESGRGVIALGLQQTELEESVAHFYPMLYVPTDEIKTWRWKNQDAILQMANGYTPLQEFILVLMRYDWELVMRASLVSKLQSRRGK